MIDEDGVLRLAVWGAGIMGERVARAASSLDGVTVVAVVDREGERARSVGDRIGARAFTDLARACESTGASAVYIGLPNAAHRDACVEAAVQRLHVLVDKPLTATSAEADDVVRAARHAGGFWMTGFSYRFRGEWQRARDVIRSGAIGEPYFVSDTVVEAFRSAPAWYWNRSAGGGVIQLQSHHVFDRWEWLFDRDVTGLCAQSIAPDGHDAELSAVIAARLGQALVASSALSFGVGYDAPPRVALTVQGTHGVLELDESRRLIVTTDAGTTEESFHDDWLVAELAAFAAGTRGNDSGLPGLAAGRRAALLAEAAVASAEGGGWISTVADRGWR
ncbi:putative dehydrogenase [Microbacterium sp. AK009]|uniref:Gfo/Idh/MocA family protein n=1 Tax=Microbacterium sp. AK009 TaxID=2723068 RepID=UPI0015CECF94|nr:Gfo/Idh/MocA family oxidoreductase [Microbacterium sp. AK009]NYF16635.1 putative dehydrogenase [Microbacterium sp. AK009]